MFPIILDIAEVPVLLVGNGPATLRRLELLDEAGARHVTLYADAPSEALKKRARDRLTLRLPDTIDFNFSRIVMIADFDEETTAELAKKARYAGALVNVEDNKPWCDFHVPAIVRRGDLLLTVSTAGKSPRLARRIKQLLAGLFDESWAERLKLIGKKRNEWRAEGAKIPELAEKTDALIEAEGWLKDVEKELV
jgi:precorrin-2 dehydrogenase / sirohydrochlorin ferrochelatase